MLSWWAALGYYLPGEQDLLRSIVAHRVPSLDRLVLLISAVGSMNVILPLCFGCLILSVLLRRGATAVHLLTVPLGYPLYALIKTLIVRPGPTPPLYPRLYDLPLAYFVEGLLRRKLQELPSQGIAVPTISQPVTAQAVTQVMESGYVSGHALLAVLFYGAIAWLIWSSIGSTRARRLGTSLFAALALIVGLARIYMGVHFPSDVLGAWFLGTAILVGVAWGTGVLWPRFVCLTDVLRVRWTPPA